MAILLVRSLLFLLAAISSVLSFLLLFGQSKEMWDGPCSHKVEYGYFEFFRISDRLAPEECAKGVIWSGVAWTAISVLLLITLNLVAYKWLRPFRR